MSMKTMEHQAPFVELLKSSESQVIIMLLAHHSMSYTLTEIADVTGLSRSTVFRVMKTLDRFKMIKSKKLVGTTYLYTFDLDTRVGRGILDLNNALVEVVCDEGIEKMKDPVYKAEFEKTLVTDPDDARKLLNEAFENLPQKS